MMRLPARFPGLRLAAALAALAGGLILSPAALAQCAMCGAAAASGKVGRGLAYSIFFLLGTLFLVVLWLVVLVYRTQLRATRVGRQQAPVTPSPLPTGHAPAEK